MCTGVLVYGIYSQSSFTGDLLSPGRCHGYTKYVHLHFVHLRAASMIVNYRSSTAVMIGCHPKLQRWSLKNAHIYNQTTGNQCAFIDSVLVLLLLRNHSRFLPFWRLMVRMVWTWIIWYFIRLFSCFLVFLFWRWEMPSVRTRRECLSVFIFYIYMHRSTYCMCRWRQTYWMFRRNRYYYVW